MQTNKQTNNAPMTGDEDWCIFQILSDISLVPSN